MVASPDSIALWLSLLSLTFVYLILLLQNSRGGWGLGGRQGNEGHTTTAKHSRHRRRQRLGCRGGFSSLHAAEAEVFFFSSSQVIERLKLLVYLSLLSHSTEAEYK